MNKTIYLCPIREVNTQRWGEGQPVSCPPPLKLSSDLREKEYLRHFYSEIVWFCFINLALNADPAPFYIFIEL